MTFKDGYDQCLFQHDLILRIWLRWQTWCVTYRCLIHLWYILYTVHTVCTVRSLSLRTKGLSWILLWWCINNNIMPWVTFVYCTLYVCSYLRVSACVARGVHPVSSRQTDESLLPDPCTCHWGVQYWLIKRLQVLFIKTNKKMTSAIKVVIESF